MNNSSSKDVARFTVAMLLLIFSVGIFGYLVQRFGINPMAHKNSVTLSQLLLTEEETPSGKPPAQQGRQTVAGAQTQQQTGFTVQPVDLEGVQTTESSLRFTRIEGSVLLQYKDGFYLPQADMQPVPAQIEGAELFPWQTLVNPPEDVGGVDDVYSFYATPDNNNFIIIMQWGLNSVGGNTRYVVYAYNEFFQEKFKKLYTFEENPEKPRIPKVSGMSADGAYATFSLFSCYECGNEIPETLVVNVRTGAVRNIGKTAEFTWLTGGQYTYKEYQEVACPEGTEANVSCALDPQFIEPQTGKI